MGKKKDVMMLIAGVFLVEKLSQSSSYPLIGFGEGI